MPAAALQILLAFVALWAPAAAQQPAVPGTQAAGGSEGSSATAAPPPAAPPRPARAIAPAEGLRWALVARDPLIQDPVSFCIGDDGAIYVAESFRQEKGVEDNRSSRFWLDDDLQLQSVEDRLRMYEKWAAKREGGMDYYRRQEDRVMRLVDTDGDGSPDRATNFSGDMREPLDGTGAGVMWLDGSLWYTCIPHLWRFRDTRGSGVADVREQALSGFGVRVALRGHDMHGLVHGPDGRIYWSIGDRGYRVRTKEGTELARPHTGAVFRCEPDGSRLEVFAHSLRNPQELAFNQWGDLFTGDNNSDGGDRARIVYVVEGGETGWDMNYQTLEGANQRGPWNQERQWWTWDAADAVRPAWSLPPIAHLGDGPAGMCFYPGVGLPARWDNHFFLCDFLGGDEYSQVRSFAVEPEGAGYKVVDAHEFVRETLCTDIDFGWDGRIYLSDWAGDGWFSDRTGELYAVWHPEHVEDVNARTAQNFVRTGARTLPVDVLVQSLWHPDIRIRQRAHLELARRGEECVGRTAAVAADAGLPVAPRLHALWALGVRARIAAHAGGAATQGTAADAGAQGTGSVARSSGANGGAIARSSGAGAAAIARSAGADAAVVARLADEHPELRRLAARLAGDAGIDAAGPKLVELLTDEDARVRVQAAIALGKLRFAEAFPNLAAMVWENDDQDPFLRHAAVMGLVGMNLPDKVRELAADPFPQTRLAAVLAMRRTGDPQLARLLHDPDLRVATEAARAINDLPVAEAMPALAALAAKWQPDEQAIAAAAETAKSRPTWSRQLWKDRKGFTAERLVADPLWDTKPDREEFGDEAVGYSKFGNDFVQRVRGSFTAPVDGEYAFSVASDDDGMLLLGRGGGAAGEAGAPGAAGSAGAPGGPGSADDRAPRDLPVPVARVEGYVNPGDWESQPGQVAKVALKAGEQVDVEARAFQGGGGSHLAVGVVHPDGRHEQPIGSFTGDVALMPLLRRVINANVRVGTPECAAAIAALAANPALPPAARVDAMEALAEFPAPSPRDRVIGHWRPVDATGRPMDAYLAVLRQRVPSLATNAPSAVRTLARELAAKHAVPMDSGAALAAVGDRTKPVAERVACLVQLAGDGDARLGQALEAALASDEPRLRAQARTIVARRDPARGVPMLREALADGTVPERQAAIAALAAAGTAESDAALAGVAKALEDGSIDPGIALDAYEAAEARPSLQPVAAGVRAALERKSRVGVLALALEGGDAERGRQVVNFHSAAACLRCHQVEGTGGHAAPGLAGVGTRHDRAGLLDSLVEPNAKVAEGFGPVSSMPSMRTVLAPRELRDVVEYLATLR